MLIWDTRHYYQTKLIIRKKNSKTFFPIPSFFLILGVVTDLQNTFLGDFKFFQTCRDLIRINQIGAIDFTHMTTLRSLEVKIYYEIFIKNRKFWGQKLFSESS